MLHHPEPAPQHYAASQVRQDARTERGSVTVVAPSPTLLSSACLLQGWVGPRQLDRGTQR